MFKCKQCGGCHQSMGEYCRVQVPFYPRPMPTTIPLGSPYPPLSQEKQKEKKMNLQPGKRYLLKRKYSPTDFHFEEITVYELAADAIKYSSAPGGFSKWVLMKYLEDNFTLYAELPEKPEELGND